MLFVLLSTSCCKEEVNCNITTKESSLVRFDFSAIMEKTSNIFINVDGKNYSILYPISNSRTVSVCPGIHNITAYTIDGDNNYMTVEDEGHVCLLYKSYKVLPRLRASRREITTWEDKSTDLVFKYLCKQYCKIKLNFPISRNINGLLICDCDGIDLSTLSPIEGHYENCFAVGENGTVEILLPRQKNSSSIQLILPYPDTMEEDRTFSLDSILRALDYDWDSESLSDIEINIDEKDIDVSIQGPVWEEGYVGDLAAPSRYISKYKS